MEPGPGETDSFAYDTHDYAPTNYFVVEALMTYAPDFNPTASFIGQSIPNITHATATAVPEPLTILGSITATGFLAAFNRIRNKKEE